MDAPTPFHPTPQTLQAYGLGMLDDASAEAVNKHLEDCLDCRRQVVEMAPDSFLGRLRDAQERPETPASGRATPGGTQTDLGRTAEAPAAAPEPYTASPGATEAPIMGLPPHTSSPQPETTVVDAATVDCPSVPYMSSTEHVDTTSAALNSPNGPGLQPGICVGYFGDYELQRVLGEGGMGIVYKARQLSLNRPVALKMIKAAQFASADDLRRFQNEAEAVARLDHPNIVPVFEVGQFEDQHYFSMKLIAGESLDKRLKDYKADPRRAASLAAVTAGAIHHAHQRGILHRDLKPANILVDPEGQPHVTDFGLAKRVEGDSELTRSGAIVGTPAYMAPEQASAKKGAVTTGTDVYGLGAVLYALLTGRGPFGGTTLLETLDQVRERAPEPPRRLNPRVPRDLEVICLKCLEKDPRRRYASADAVAEDLKHWLAGEPIVARPVGNAARLWMWCRRNPVVAGAAGLVATALVVVAVLSLLYAGQQTRLADARKLYADEQTHRAEDQTGYAQKQAEAAARIAIVAESYKVALTDSNRRLAMLNFERGQAACDQGQISLGLLWMVESLRAATDAGDPVWKNVALTSLSAWQRLHPRLRGVFDEAETVALSPDGKTVVTGNSLGAQLWDTVTGRSGVIDSDDMVEAVAFSPDGKTILTGSLDKSARLWDLATGQPIGKPIEHQGAVRAVAFSPDGKTILTASDKTTRLSDAATSQHIGQPMVHQARVYSVAFSPDGKTVLSCSGDRTVRLWDATTSQHIGQPMVHQARVYSVAFSPDGKTILTGSQDKTARLWNAATGQPIGKAMEHQGAVWAVTFSPDGKTILTGTVDESHYTGSVEGSAWLWDAATGRLLAKPLEHRGGVNSVAFGPDGKSILIRSSDGLARLWDVTTAVHIGKPLEDQGLVSAVAFSPDGKTILTGSLDKTARLWDAATGRPIGKPIQHQEGVEAVAFSPDGKTILTGSRDKTARLWHAATGQPIGEAMEHQGAVWTVSFSPDGKTVLTGSEDGTSRLWDATTSLPIGKPEHRGSSEALAFSPDGKTILTGSMDKTARLWGLATGLPIGRPIQHQEAVEAVAFSPDGKTILTGSQDKTARLWHAATGQPIGKAMKHQGAVSAVAFSPDGKTILTGSEDGTARLWDATTGQPVGPPLQQAARFFSVAESFGDEFAKMMAIGQSLGGHLRAQLMSVAFSPDGKTILTASRDAAVPRRWGTSAQLPADLPRLAAWVQTMSGLELDEHGVVHALDSAAWRKRRELLGQLGGPPTADSTRSLDPILFESGHDN